jgi:hypothetical protein
MTEGLNKTILPICKPTAKEKLRKVKHTRIRHFMHGILKIEIERIVGVVGQGSTYLTLQTGQSLIFEDLEDYPTLMHLINDNQKYKP